MTASRSRNLLWAVLVLGIGAALLIRALDVLPAGINDILERSWAIVLVIAGLNMFLAERIRFGNWAAVVISGAALAGIVFFAYDAQSNEIRTDYVEAIDPVPLGDNIQTVYVTVDVLATQIIVRPVPLGYRGVQARFVGSEMSRVSIVVQQREDDPASVDVVITETNREGIPELDKIGRGELLVLLPEGIEIPQFNITGQSGGSTLDLSTLSISRFDIDLAFGNLALYMPSNPALIGNVTVSDGNLQMWVDPDINLRILNAPPGNRATVDSTTYLFTASGEIEKRGATDFIYDIRLDVPTGTFQLSPPN